MRVLVTGSAGRVGRAIHVHLSRHGHVVSGLDRTPASTVDHVGDLAAPGLLDRALEGRDAVVHTAALHAPHVNNVSDTEFERVNVEGTASVVEAARRAGVRRIVFTSTTALYGKAARPEGRVAWVDEALAPEPVTVYHRTKLAAEALLREAAAAGLVVRVLRMSRCFPEPVDLMAVYRLHRGVDARDVAQAHRLCLEHGGEPWEAFVVSGSTPFEPADLEDLHADTPSVLRRRAPALVRDFEARGFPLPARIDRVCSPAKARRELGWVPRFGYEDVLRQHDEESSEVLPPRP